MAQRYTQQYRLKVAKEAALPEYKGLEHIIAQKYQVKVWTVIKWRDAYLQNGEDGLKKGFSGRSRKSSRETELEKENAELKEEIRILKKAAAFLADLRRE